jgi:serine protease
MSRARAALAAVLCCLAASILYPTSIWSQAGFTPNDPLFGQQWSLFEGPSPEPAGVGMPTAWNTNKGAGIIVAVLDTGYTDHPDLDDNLVLPGYDFVGAVYSNDGDGRDGNAHDPGDGAPAGFCSPTAPAILSSWHGTHVAGIIAAETNTVPGEGVAGIAHEARILPVRVAGRCAGAGSVNFADVADGIIWAVGGNVTGVPVNENPAHVINISIWRSGACPANLQAAITEARSRGVPVVTIAGNNNGASAASYHPGNCAGVITVAALERDGDRGSYSNKGSVVDLVAPGGAAPNCTSANNILSTSNSGTAGPDQPNYRSCGGTSFAAPHVAGIAALVLSINPQLTPDQVETLLKNTARPFPSGSDCTTSTCGAGVVDATAAVTAAGQPIPAAPTSLTTSGGFSSPNYQVTWQQSGPYSYFLLEESYYDSSFASPVVYQTSSPSEAFSGQPTGEYWYRAKACNSGGLCGGYSNKKLKLVCNPQCN